jgi:ribosomal protein S27AE
MSTNDGGPAFPCSKCGIAVQFIADWQHKDKRCPACKRAQQNAANLAKGDRLRDEAKEAYRRRKQYYQSYWLRARLNPSHIQKRAARRKVATEIEAGRLQRQSCRSCGATKADAHHHDYSKPLDIQWLCRRCHFAEERRTA